MIRPLHLTLSALALAGLATGLSAQDNDVDPAVKARQSHMTLNSFNLGLLGNMARGNIDYDAEAAQAAADNLVALASLDQTRYWPEGTDSDSIEGTRALPAIWENIPDVMAKAEALETQAATMAEVAGDGLDAMRGQIQALGGACGDCHDNYRLSND